MRGPGLTGEQQAQIAGIETDLATEITTREADVEALDNSIAGAVSGLSDILSEVANKVDANAEVATFQIEAISQSVDEEIEDRTNAIAAINQNLAEMGGSLDDVSALADINNAALVKTQMFPGECPYRYTTSLVGETETAPPIYAGIVQGERGLVVQVTGQGLVALRERVVLSPSTTLRVRYGVRRKVDQTDPIGDSVQLGIQWLDRLKNPISRLIVRNIDLRVANGLESDTAFVSAASAEGVSQWPSNAMYMVPYIRTYGPDGVTHIERIQWDDVSDVSGIVPPDLADLVAQATAAAALAEEAAAIVADVFDQGTAPVGPWSFTASEDQTTYVATGSIFYAVDVKADDQPLTLNIEYTRNADTFTFNPGLNAGKYVEITPRSFITGLNFLDSSIITPSPGGTLSDFVASRGRDIWITDFPWFADPTGEEDAAPAFRAARNHLSLNGGGVIYCPSRSTFKFASTEAVTVWEIDEQQTSQVCVALPAGVSLIGPGSHTTKIISTDPSTNVVIATLDGANQAIKGLEIQGNGATVVGPTGVFNYSSQSYAHVLENVEFSDLYINDFGSYGLGNNLVCRNVSVEKIKTRRTGADGVDWKQRGTSLDAMSASPTTFRNIDIDEFGQRVGAGSPTGLGIRGPAHIDGISVKGVPNGIAGIMFVGGIAAGGDVRLSGSYSSITNWSVEGADPKGDAIAISIFASEAVRVGPGVAKYARCQTVGRTPSPYGFDDSGTFDGATVIPAHGRTAFELVARSSHIRGGRIISDKVYWDARRSNLVEGQTILPLPFSSETNNDAPRYVVKITTVDEVETRSILTEGDDYTWGSNFVTLVDPANISDQFFAVFPPLIGYRVEAFNCSVLGVQDFFVPDRISISTQPQADSGEFHVVWEGRANIGQINSTVNMGLYASDSTVTDKSFLIRTQGAGSVAIAAADNKLSFFAVGGATKQTITGATTEEQIASVVAIMRAYGFAN